MGHLKKIKTSLVLKNKKKRKGKDCSITESSTILEIKNRTEARNSFGFSNV